MDSNRTKDIIFINADDFGLNLLSNERINYCLNQNLISTTTIVVNTPGFDSAVHYIHTHGYYGRIGFHANIASGSPLSEKMKKFLGDKDMGDSRYYFSKHIFSREEQIIIYSEINEQLRRLYDNGVVPTHIDTHGHMHKYIGILRIIKHVAREHGIPYVRRCRNLYTKLNIKNIFLKRLYDIYFDFSRVNSSRYFTSLKSYVENNSNLLNVELMCHPGDDNEFAFLNSKGYRSFLDERKSCISLEPFTSSIFNKIV